MSARKTKKEKDENSSEDDDALVDEAGDSDEDLDLGSPETLAKYQFAADTATKVMKHLIASIAPGKKIIDLCEIGDRMIGDEIKTRYTKGKLEKGIAFPTSISVNNCAGHYSPLKDDKAVLSEGDIAKIDLSVHVDGYVSSVATTVIVRSPETKTQVTSGRPADVVCAAHFAAEAALRLIRPGSKNTDVTDVIQKVAETFHVTPLEGVLSHQLKRFVIDGNRVILNKVQLDQKVEEFTFEENEVYSLDIVMSSGEGKAKETETKTTIYKRSPDTNYLLKLKAARYVLNEINNRFATFPFCIRALDETRGKFGIVECLNHGLVQPYPVLYEKPGEVIAQIKFTVFLLPTQTIKANALPLPFVSSQYSITDPSLQAILEQGTKRKNAAKKNKKKKKKKPASANNSQDSAEKKPDTKGDKMDTS